MGQTFGCVLRCIRSYQVRRHNCSEVLGRTRRDDDARYDKRRRSRFAGVGASKPRKTEYHNSASCRTCDTAKAHVQDARLYATLTLRLKRHHKCFARAPLTTTLQVRKHVKGTHTAYYNCKSSCSLFAILQQEEMDTQELDLCHQESPAALTTEIG